MIDNTDEKYITFRRETFFQQLGEWSTFNMATRPAPLAVNEANMMAIKDAVVIRRQDYFASPCLATYASMIALVGQRESDPKVREELLAVADYFERQAQLAAEEGWKLPTP